MRVALDTNILAYAEGVNGVERRDAALMVLKKLPQRDTIIPVQALGELFNVLVRKAGRGRGEARDAILSWNDTYPTATTTAAVMLAASDLAVDHRLGIWDAVILAVASQVGCRLLLSKDLHDGFTWGGVTVADPFAAPRHPLLATLLA